MTGIGQASGILAARDGLWQAIKTATGDMKLDRYYGMPDVVHSHGWVGLGELRTVTEDLPVAGRQTEETITIDVSIGKWVPGHRDETAEKAYAEAFDILRAIQEHIRRDDITLGGAVLWCLPGPVESDGIDGDDGGYLADIAASFVCSFRVRAR